MSRGINRIAEAPQIIKDYLNPGLMVHTIRKKHAIGRDDMYAILRKNGVPPRAYHSSPSQTKTMPKKFGTIKTASKENVEVGQRTADGGLVLQKVVLKKDTIFEYTLNYGMYKTLEDAHV